MSAHRWMRGLDGAYDPYDWHCTECGTGVDGAKPADGACPGRKKHTMNTRDPVTFGPYTVSIDVNHPDHAVIRRVDGMPPQPTWYELQNMKGIAFGSHARAVEVFPENAALYDTANMRHLWCVPSTIRTPCLYTGGMWDTACRVCVETGIVGSAAREIPRR